LERLGVRGVRKEVVVGDRPIPVSICVRFISAFTGRIESGLKCRRPPLSLPFRYGSLRRHAVASTPPDGKGAVSTQTLAGKVEDLLRTAKAYILSYIQGIA